MARKRSQASSAPRRSRLNLSLEDALVARLGAYAAWRREPISAVVARAVEVEMAAQRFRVSCSPPCPAPVVEAPGSSQDGPEGVGEVLRAG